MYAKYGAQAQFLMIYLREAHPADGWRMRGWDNGITDPRNLAERRKVGTRCKRELKFEFPGLADRMDDRVAVRWAGWPERLFVVSKAGKVVYAGGQGPWGYWPTDRYKRRGRGRGVTGPSLMGFLDGYFGDRKTSPEKKSSGDSGGFH